MLSKVDLRDLLEINQGLYNEPVSAAHLALAQAWGLAADTKAALTRNAQTHEHTINH